MTSIDFKEDFNAYVRAHQKKWSHDRKLSVGASEAFGCLRKAWFSKHDVERDSDYKESWGALQRGDMIENHFVEPAMRWAMENLHGEARLVWGGKRQRTLIEGRLSATPDGLVINAADDALAKYGIPSLGGSGCFNLEVKSIDPRVNLKEEKAVHRGQVIVQMGLMRMKTRYKPRYAVILYVDASFFDDIEIFIVEFDQQAFNIAQARANEVYTVKNPVEILPEGKIDGTCDYCPWQSACAKTNETYTPQDGEASNAEGTALPLLEEFERLVREERAAQADKKACEAAHKEASERLKQWFRETGVRRAVAADASIKASITWVKGKQSYDIEAMRADGIDVEKFVKVGDGHDRLIISEKGAQKAEAD